MGLYDQIKEIAEEENKALGEDVAANEKEPTHAVIPADEPEPKKPAKDATPAKEEEPVEDPAKVEPEKDAAPTAEAPPSSTDFARMRREKAAAERRADAAEAALRKPTEPAAPVRTATEKAVLAEPDANLDPEAHLRWKLSKTEQQLQEISVWKNQKDQEEQRKTLREGAIKEYSRYENDFMPTVTDYKEVTAHGIQAIQRSISTLNPALKGDDLAEAVRMQVLRLGAQAEQRGEDPAEFFYNQSKAWGYQPKAAEPAVEPEKKPAPSMKQIAEHKKKSATSLTPGGKSGNAPLSKEAVMSKNFTVADFAKLTPSQLRELESMEA